jgi:hypothetical protein
MYLENVPSYNKCAYHRPHLISDFRMIIFVYFFPNASGLASATNLRKWAEKAFASSTLVFHALGQVMMTKDYLLRVDLTSRLVD